MRTQCWMPDEPPRALLAIAHGVTEHSDRYRSMVPRLLAGKVGVCGFDLRGHGRSSGHRGHVDRWQDYISDLDRFLHTIQTRHPGLPIFLFGHSLGSLIVLSYGAEQPHLIRGMVVCGAAIEPAGVARPHLVLLARAFSSIWPTFPIPVRPRTTPFLSRDPQVEAEFLADPLVLKKVTARFGIEALAMIAHVRRNAPMVKGPLLMIHGGVDPLNSVNGAQGFFNEVTAPDKRIIIYPGSYHEPHNDLDRDEVLGDLCAWILSHL